MEQIIIPSTHVNAVGLALSLRAVQFKGRIICLAHKSPHNSIAGRFPRLCNVEPISMEASAQLPDYLAKRFEPAKTGILFTDERHIQQFLTDGRFTYFAGAGGHLDTVCDKRRFYRFLETQELAPIPRSIASTEDPFAVFDGAFRSRVWRSWSGTKRHPRGRLIRNRTDLETWQRESVKYELAPSDWGYQIQLSAQPRDNVSVVGWHSATMHRSIVTRRVAVSSGIGWIVERVFDLSRLMNITRRVLNALDFHGPFELEFVRDPADDTYRVIELNPRFWMQHRLFQNLTDHAVMKHFLGEHVDINIARGGPTKWLQPDVALSSPLLALRHAPNAIWAHPFQGVIGARAKQKLKSAFKGLKR